MNNKAKVLLIVEGTKLEPQFFNKLKESYGIELEIFCVNNNIYSLYQNLKELSFQADIKAVLSERITDSAIKERLADKYTYTYLVFDLDPHNVGEEQKETPKSLKEIIAANIERVREMTDYFTDETDPAKGKIYINYPMMESYRDCDSFEDETYLKSKVPIEEVPRYKQHVGTKRMANKRLDTYTKEDFNKLSKQNIRKLYTINGQNRDRINYTTYQIHSHQTNILKTIQEIFENDSAISVLNTATYFAIDYYGNKNQFFDKIINQ